MSKKKKARRGSAPSQRAGGPPPAAGPIAPAGARSRAWWWWIALAAIAGFALTATLAYHAQNGVKKPPPVEVAASSIGDYVGAKACAACHARETEGWKGSHHDLAMQHANAQSVLGNFDDARFSYAGITSTFFRRDGKFLVNTDGPDGKLRDYEI